MPFDRTIPPVFQAVQEIRLPAVQTQQLDNGVSIHSISVAHQPVLRLECVFEAGVWYEHAPATSFFTLKMLVEGTKARSSAEISEYIDRYGVFMEQNSGPDRASVVVYCLTKFLPNVLPLLREILTEPTFPDKELEDLRNITLQNLQVNYEKNAYLASVMFRQKLFGIDHPYGRTQRPDFVAKLTHSEIKEFYGRTISLRPFQLILAGNATENELLLINQELGQLPIHSTSEPAFVDGTLTTDHLPVLEERPASSQSSIRVGRRLFNRSHPDFFKMLVANEVLGGYFGSRLMKNIREEKGFTYGIHSSMPSFRHDGYFTIGTDVNKENTQQTLDEIRKEIRVLQTVPVPIEELDVVKNYMAGEFVGSLNTPFEIADRYKVILLDGMPADFLSTYIHKIRSVSQEEILEVATKYWAEEQLREVVVGGK